MTTESEETVSAVQLFEEDLIVMAERQDELLISVLVQPLESDSWRQ